MKSKRKKTYYRRFKTGAMNHIYQRTVSRGILFYSEIDALVCLSAIYVMAKRYDITIIAICFMVDHIHLLVYTDSKDKMSIFVQEYTSVFARKYNISISREGAVFEPRFGSAPKVSDKEIRTCTAYIYNNPVEKSLCSLAEDWKWNFLTFIDPDKGHVKYLKTFSRPFQRAHNAIKRANTDMEILNYSLLRKAFKEIKESEREIMTDFIIRQYLPIDFEELLSYYEDKDSMFRYFHYSKAKEYDIKEEYDSSSDAIYTKMAEIISGIGKYKDVKEVIMLPDNDKMELAAYLTYYTSASTWQIAKFLHTNTGQQSH